MKKKLSIGLVGFGNMGRALGEALLSESAYQLLAYDKEKKKLKGIDSIIRKESLEKIIPSVNVVILAIKPQDIEIFIKDAVRYFIKKRPLLISIAAGVPTYFFEKRIKGIRVIRVMPNLAVKVRSSVSFMCKGKLATKKDLDVAYKIFSCVGKVFVIKESFLDKVTSISGSGPGYVYYFMDAIMKSALKLGFSQEIARMMIEETFLGAVRFATLSGKEFSKLIEDVASRGGTTESALRIFTKKRLNSIINEAINSAYKKAKELANYYHK